MHALPLLLSGRVRLIDSSKLRVQLASLERHVLAGREVVRHPAVASAHDDIAAAAAGAIAAVKQAAAVREVPIVMPIIVRAPESFSGLPFPTRDEWSPRW